MGGHNLAGKKDLVLSTFGGLIAMSDPQGVPFGGSPRTYDTDFEVSSVTSRAGRVSLFSFSGSGESKTAGNAFSTSWVNAGGVLAGDTFASVASPDGTQTLDITEFGFNIPASSSITGLKFSVSTVATAASSLNAQVLMGGVPYGPVVSVPVGTIESVVIFGGDSQFAAGITSASANNVAFGVRLTASTSFTLATVSVKTAVLTLFLASQAASFSYVKTFETRQGIIKTLALDFAGNLWIEDVTNAPGKLSLLDSGKTPNSYGKSITLNDREYICYSDLRSGSDIPEQYTGDWRDRVTQVGPGAPPTVTVSASASDSYPIQSITQPAAQSRGFSYFLQSTGPGSTSPGNVVTIYYSDSTGSGADMDLVSAFNSGNPVYAYVSFSGGPQQQGPYTVLITSVGEGSPPNQPRPFYYFTYTLPTVAYTLYAGSGHGAYTAHYQRSLATLTTSVPVPNLVVNSKMAIAGSSVAAYNQTWTVAQDLDSGSMTVSQTSLTAGVATYSYAVSAGQPPTAGQLVTVTNTLNANGDLNGINLTIASSTAGTTGSFTVNGFQATTDYPALSEQGTAVTAGEVFSFDPGALQVGTTNNPIYGNSSGGNIVFQGSGQLIGQGIRQLVEFYIDRNGTQTFPSPPVTFTTPANTSKIVVSNASIGPPNVVMRGYAITEPGQNGVPGANFFTIPQDISYTVGGVKYLTPAFLIPDNVATTAAFNFLDSQLINATAIDIQGNDLFNQIEIGNPAWVTAYASRLFFGLCQSRVPNFINLSFDGGRRANSQLPLGWTVGTLGQSDVRLLNSPIFGYSYYVQNTTGTSQLTYGLISQTAYQDVYKTPIIRANTLYSVRVTARTPSENTGDLVVDLISTGMSEGAFVIPAASLTTSFQTFTGPLLTAKMGVIPSDLRIELYSANLPSMGDFEVDRIEVFTTQQPTLSTQVLASYVNRFAQVDQDSGNLDTATENQQACNGAVVMNDLLYLLKESSLFYTQNSPGEEPDQWTVHSVSADCGAAGPLAYDSPEDPNSGQKFITTACRNGLYLFTGGEPGRIMLEIVYLWNAIYWPAARGIWVKQDIARQRIYVGVPLPTPNVWLPNAPANPTPQTPNVVLMCNYQGIDTGEELKAASSVIKAAFAGNLEVPDLRRKWSIWQIPTLNGALIKRSESLDALFALCNGSSTGKIYAAGGITDDGQAINALYTTAAFTDSGTVDLGGHRKNFSYFQGLIDNAGDLQMRILANTLEREDDVRIFTDSTQDQDVETDINTTGQRVYLEFSSNEADAEWSLSNAILTGNKAPWSPLRGV